MHRILFICALCLVTTEVSAQDQLAGDWHDYWFRAGNSPAVTLHVERARDEPLEDCDEVSASRAVRGRSG
jgi:hypothetical protein